MDRYWRIGGSFTAFKYVSKAIPDMFVVGVIIHENGASVFEDLWDEMKQLIPEEYYYNYDILKTEIASGSNYIVFDTYEQGEEFVAFIEENFNENHMGYAVMFVDGECVQEST